MREADGAARVLPGAFAVRAAMTQQSVHRSDAPAQVGNLC
jgi:hypothetical protein